MRLLPWILVVMALAGVMGLSLHSRDLAERVGATGIRLREAEQRAAFQRAEAERERDEATEVELGLLETVAGLEQRLEDAIGREREVLSLLQERVAREQAAREERQARQDQWSRAMPEGVRLSLLALQDCLLVDGYPGIRFVRAVALDGEGLRQVEVLDHDPARLTSVLYLAGRMTATLDRMESRLELRFFDGHRVVDGSRSELPEEGFPLVLESVYGPLWEASLPLLVRAEGVYPEEDGDVSKPGLDSETRWLWQERLDTLLETARYNEMRMRIASFRGMDGPRFEKVALLGYDEGNLLQMAASVERLAVEVDKDARVVNLLLEGGTLRRKGGESTISPDGYRLLLDRVTPEKASDIMLGMVVKR